MASYIISVVSNMMFPNHARFFWFEDTKGIKSRPQLSTQRHLEEFQNGTKNQKYNTYKKIHKKQQHIG